MPRGTRQRLPEWEPFAAALRDLVSGAGLSKESFADVLGRGFERRRVGGILEARDPCPEDLLLRLYRRAGEDDHRELRDVAHLRFLVDLWVEAAGKPPGNVLREQMERVGTPWDDEMAAAEAGRPTGGTDVRSLQGVRRPRTSRRSYTTAAALLGVIALVAFVAVERLNDSRSNIRLEPDALESSTETHVFPPEFTARARGDSPNATEHQRNTRGGA